MKLIDRVYDIWKDLDVSYDKLKKEGESKRDFLFRLSENVIGVGHKLDMLKAKVMEFYDSDQEKCIFLSDRFDLVAKLMYKLETVTNINRLETLFSEGEAAVGAPVIDMNDIACKLNPFILGQVKVPVSLETALAEVGYFFNVYGADYSMEIEETIRPDVVLLQGTKSEILFLKQLNRENSPDSLHMFIYSIVAQKKRDGFVQPVYQLFVNKKHFRIRKGQAVLVFGDEEYSLHNTVTRLSSNTGRYYEADLIVGPVVMKVGCIA